MSYFQTYNKKRFFKSRNKTATATSASESQPPPKPAADFTEKEPPRVPPVSEHFVQIAAVGDTKSSSTAEKSASNQVSKILASGINFKFLNHVLLYNVVMILLSEA